MLRETTIPVRVSALTVDPFTNLPVVILVDDLEGTTIPISVGIGEATAIATELDHIELERPMTHQLVAAMLAKLGAVVEAVEVRDLVGGIFYATIRLTLENGECITQDARPSDALALALHTGAEITVTPRVVDKLCRCRNGRHAHHTNPGSSLDLEGLGDDAFGKWKV